MKDSFKAFIDSIESVKTKRVVNSFKVIGDYDYSNCTSADLEQIILSMNPKSPRNIITICYIIGAYAKFLNNENLYNLEQSLDRNALWEKAKPNAPKKFLSHSDFISICHDVGTYEEFNSLYYQALFSCLYEGIYNEDMSVLINLRASDIRDNVVTLHEDNGHSYDLEISTQLAEDLKELGKIDVWERRNRWGIYNANIEGLHPDSCFKVENRNGSSEYAYRFSYYRMIRKIINEYLERSLTPLQLYISGIMYRIKIKLQENDIELEDAFSKNNHDRLVSEIISDELKRCNYDIDVKNFREIVKGHIDVFNS